MKKFIVNNLVVIIWGTFTVSLVLYTGYLAINTPDYEEIPAQLHPNDGKNAPAMTKHGDLMMRCLGKK